MAQLERGIDFNGARLREEAALNALTSDRVNEVLCRLLRPDVWVTVVRGTACD